MHRTEQHVNNGDTHSVTTELTTELVQQADQERALGPLLSRSPEATIGVLYMLYAARLRSAFFGYSDVTRDNEDIVQEAFALALRNYHLFKSQSSFYTWIYQIARNTAISQSRGKRHSMTSLDAEVLHEIGLDMDPNAIGGLEKLLKIEDIGMVRHAMGELSEEHQMILQLREFEEMKYDLIAEMLQVPVGTVRSRLSRARTELRQTLIALILGATLGDKRRYR